MFDQKRILAIASEAVNRKGYVLYEDYNEYLRELICKERKLEPSRAGQSLREIRAILKSNGYISQEKRGEKTRFYPK